MIDQDQEKDLEQFKALYDDPKWRTFRKVLEDNIKALDERIIEGGADEAELDKLRERRRAYNDMASTPDEFIRKLTRDGKETVNMNDPFDQYEKENQEI